MEQKDIIELYQILNKRFDESELRTLCFYLGIDFENLPGDGKVNKVRELISYLKRRSELDQLVEVGEQLRPDISWDDFHKPSDIDYQAELISQSFSQIQCLPRSIFMLKVDWKNIGKKSWPRRVRMGTVNPRDRISGFYVEGKQWISLNRIEFNEIVVYPEEIATFEITLKAPSSLGLYHECFGLVYDEYRWFNECPVVCVDILVRESQLRIEKMP